MGLPHAAAAAAAHPPLRVQRGYSPSSPLHNSDDSELTWESDSREGRSCTREHAAAKAAKAAAKAQGAATKDATKAKDAPKDGS